MKTIIKITFIASAIAMQSCATIFSGTSSTIKIRSGIPSSAKVYLNGNYQGEAPCNINVSKNSLKKNETVIEIKSKGYKTQQVSVGRKVKVGAIFCNLIFTGIFGLIIDIADAAIFKPYPDIINYNLDDNVDNIIPIHNSKYVETKQSNDYTTIQQEQKTEIKIEHINTSINGFIAGDSVKWNSISGLKKGKIIDVQDNYADVEFSTNGKLKSRHFPYGQFVKIEQK